MKIIYTTVLLIFISSIIGIKCFSQEKKAHKEFSEAIEDNSFLIEEAYNQEKRIVQHIFNGYWQYQSYSHDLLLSFTQEWPLFGYKHQLSYSIPYNFYNPDRVNGIGDMMINYRYQLLYEENWLCLSPRLSVIIPTGSTDKGFGNGVFGIQINIPASKRLLEHLVVHVNAGFTFLPHAKSSFELETDYGEIIHSYSYNDLYFYNIGASVIWLADRRINFLLEYLTNFNSSFNYKGNLTHDVVTIINPGCRVSIPVNKLEIVPGISIPITINGDAAAFFYLSFEHPF
jgi:hypothetical protein